MKLTAEDASCWVDGHWGWDGPGRVISFSKTLLFRGGME